MVVQHVTVAEGGQAIVGNVSAPAQGEEPGLPPYAEQLAAFKAQERRWPARHSHHGDLHLRLKGGV
jgi:hypothetical protein